MQIRQRWFDEGAEALHRFVELRPGSMELPDGDFYCCPCCMWAFGPDALVERELTVEHVPADSVGGREMLLTCKECNNRAGDQLDVYAANREDFRQFMTPGGTSKRYKVVLDADGILLRGDAWMENGTLKVVGVDKQNHDVVRDMHVRKLNDFVATGMTSPPLTFKVRVSKMSDIRANLSWIRAAYLVAVCAFGLPYALHAAMAELRDALDKPGSSSPPLLISRNEDDPKGRRVMGVVREPVELLLVGLDQYDILLPSPTNMISLSEIGKILDENRVKGGTCMNVQVIEFPRKAEYRYL